MRLPSVDFSDQRRAPGPARPVDATASANGGRFIGIDVGAETVKAVELVCIDGKLAWTRRAAVEHRQQVAAEVTNLLQAWNWSTVTGAAVTGRMGRLLNLPPIPVKQAQRAGARHLLDPEPLTLVSIGSHGFSILELRPNGIEVFRENSRCSQGTGNFLRQLVGRFSLTIEEASRLCTDVARPAVLSGRCPVILKTDMTHLANKGEDRAAILAGLFDAVCENVLVLIKPELCPKRIALIGGVARAPRVQATFQSRLASLGLGFLVVPPEDILYFEAVGSALAAAANPVAVPSFDRLMCAAAPATLERVPALRDSSGRVHRMTRPPLAAVDRPDPDVVIGLDIGSTGAKAVALDSSTQRLVWESYRATGGDPVGAAQALMRTFAASPVAAGLIRGFGATGSGREIVGSLLAACYGKESVYVLNEIAAHAEGALSFDPRVDTIFEIGGQDAKYIRLAEGRIVDCAMNEACSAGTGSFIEEQGGKFAGVRDVVHLASEAMAADEGVSLGQHCSVFMAEVIDEAVAAGVPNRAIIAGLYDSIIQNYLNRVKGSRSVGRVIFCQGMPFASDALAAAVARQTGADVIVPPNPGTVGALGIARLAARELAASAGVDLPRFLAARVDSKDTFQCRANVGCGGVGNRCRIERLRTVVAGKTLPFTWGGGCALYDKATRKRKLPDRAPDPFREREELVRALVRPALGTRGRPRVALTDEFALKGLLPYFATLVHELGFEVLLAEPGEQPDLKRGIRGANVPFCAPMQLYHGVTARLAASGADYVLLPMLRSVPTVDHENHAVACPIVQASADLVRWDIAGLARSRVISPIIDLDDGGFDSPAFLAAARDLAAALGVPRAAWKAAHDRAGAVQAEFERGVLEVGRRALEYCADHGVVPVVVLGRPYTIYNPVLNSNVPAILREQGAIGIPVDCYPVDRDLPSFGDMYWGYGQRVLRTAHQVRRTPAQYSVYCSNYACGPDSFNLHFYSHVMAGKPFAIIETDGHAGDAGTKTRIEAFLHCVEQDRRASGTAAEPNDFGRVQVCTVRLREILDRRERVLIPWMSDASRAVAAALRGRGVAAESLPHPGRDALRIGRRFTSGKECLPIALTLGGLLRRLEIAGPEDRFVYLMSSTYGPCRFGVYNLLNQIVLQRHGWADRVRIWSPRDTGYFAEFPAAFGILTFAGLAATDLLNEAALSVRGEESRAGTAMEIYAAALRELEELLEREAAQSTSTQAAFWQVVTGELFGLRALLRRTAARLAAIRDGELRPTVLLVGEIYVRSVPFANDFMAEKLQDRGLRVRIASIQEWLAYCDAMAARERVGWRFGPALSDAVQARIRDVLSATVDEPLGWPTRHETDQLLASARPYLSDRLEGEAVLTLGGPLCAWHDGQIDGVVSTGPHECMPNKIAESQFFHIAEREGLPSLTIPVNGDPTDSSVLDNFAYEVLARFRAKHPIGSAKPPAGRAVARIGR